MSKKDRLNSILKLIQEQEICTQEELTDKLIALGYDVSQSTVSRDINELNLIKTEGVNKRFKYITANSSTSNVSAQMINLFKQITVSMTYANNLIVIKTLGGNASSAGMAVDAMHFPQVLGTVAGDDTLLVVTKNNSDAEVVLKSLRLL